MSSLLLTIAALTLMLQGAFGQASSAYLTGLDGAAVDVKGTKYRSQNYPGRLPPWMADRTKSPAPDYPYAERARHHVGHGYFRLVLDLKTGAVTRVTILNSTGHPALDQCAVAALRQWRWNPGKWKEIETSVVFRLSYKEPDLPRGSVRLPLH